VNSCNVYFYNVGKELGIDRISHFATMMGLAAGPESTFRMKTVDSFLPPNGSSGSTKRRGMPVRRYQSPSARGM